MNIFSICGVMFIAVVLSSLLGQYKPEYKITILRGINYAKM